MSFSSNRYPILIFIETVEYQWNMSLIRNYLQTAKNIKPVLASFNDPPLTRSVIVAADKDSTAKDISLRQNGAPDGDVLNIYEPISSRMSDSVN